MQNCYSVWVLFCNLAIAKLDDGLSVTKSELSNNFVRTTVFRGLDLQLKYCDYKDQNQAHRTLGEPIDLDQLIDLYKTFNFTISYEHTDSPIIQSGVLSINDFQELPLFLTADIRQRHIPINPDSAPGYRVDEQMELMGQLATDDRVYLLPFNSKGGTREHNVVPMAQNVYRHRAVEYDSSDLVTDKPSSSWRSNENWIRRFLKTYPNGRVAWKVAVQYAAGVVADPRRRRAFRPVRFALQYSAYTGHDETTSLFYGSPQTTFVNENNDSCANNFRPLPSECRLPNKTRAIGAVLSQAKWGLTHLISFPYTIENRTFFYGHQLDEGHRWFIQELLPNGQMGEEISSGNWGHHYKTGFPFSINGRQFFYTHRGSGGTDWFIQQLLPDGKMGKKISSGNSTKEENVSIPFTVAGKQYFYGQTSGGHQWFIQELLPNGTMGKETIKVNKNKASPVAFVYKINDRQFLYSHNIQDRTWQTQELLPGGTLGQETSYGQWATVHHTSVPHYINGKHFFFGQNLDNGYWFVQELRPKGQMGIMIAQGRWDDRYAVVFAYVVNGRHFMFAHSQKTMAWVIKELL